MAPRCYGAASFLLTIVLTAIMAVKELPNFPFEFDCLQETSTQRKSLSEKELDVRKFKTFLEAEP